MTPRVFISYRREDGATLAERLALELQSRRITVFYDSDSIALSDAWRREIDQGLDEMDALILVLTKKALESDEVQSEWNDALSQKKPVFCLVVPEVPDSAVPSRLKIVNYARISSEDDFLAALAHILLEIKKPAAVSAALAASPGLNAGHDGREDPAPGGTGAAVSTPAAFTARQAAVVAGDWPWNLKGALEGRDEEAMKLSRLLADPATSVVGVTGRAGIGKTALTCRVLDSVRQRNWLHEATGPAVDGIAILGSRTGGLSLDRLIERCSQLLGEHGHRIDLATTLSVEEKVSRLLDALGEGTFILLFDHLDDLIDSKGQLVDAGLRTCFEEFLRRPQSVRLVFTCREPLDLPADAQPFARQYPLEGLPSDAGIAMLRALDPDGRKQLRAAGAGKLAATVRRLHGVPRALQLFASLIERDPFFDWAEWLDRSGTGRGFLDDLIRENYARLTGDERHLLQAFAVFRAPVPVPALRHLLGDRPDDATLRESLARLWRARMVERQDAKSAAADPPARGRSEPRFSIHATDQDYVYSHLPASGEWSKPSLERKVAAYYRSIRPPRDAWRTRDGLEPLVLEFDHLIKASEFADAAGMLDLIDDYLVLTGRAYKCREMWLALDGKLTEPRAVARHLLGLGLIDIRLGAIEQGRARLVKGKAIIAGTDNMLEGELTGWLGESARRLGRFDESFDYTTEAVRLFEAAANREQVARWKCELSLLSSYRGDPKSAIAVAMESLALAREAGNAPFEALALDALALGWLVAGRPAEAISNGRQALTHYEGSVWEPTRMYVLNVVGLASAMAGRSGAAIEELEHARTLAEQHHDARVQGLVQFNMARVRRQQGQLPVARQELERATATFDRLNAGERKAAHSFARVLDADERDDDHLLASALVDCARDSMSWPDILVPVDLLDEAALLIAKLGDGRLDSERAGLSARIEAIRAL